MALLVPKGIQRFPDTGDTVKVSCPYSWLAWRVTWSVKVNSAVDTLVN